MPVPGKTAVIPGKTEPVPDKTEPVPGKTEPVPGKIELVPGKTEPVPGKTEPVPGKTELVPGKNELVPRKNDVIPGRRRRSEEGTGTSRSGSEDRRAEMRIRAPSGRGSMKEGPHERWPAPASARLGGRTGGAGRGGLHSGGMALLSGNCWTGWSLGVHWHTRQPRC